MVKPPPEWTKAIDSVISVSESANNSILINNEIYNYFEPADAYVGGGRTFVTFSGNNKTTITITDEAGLANTSYRIFTGEKL